MKAFFLKTYSPVYTISELFFIDICHTTSEYFYFPLNSKYLTKISKCLFYRFFEILIDLLLYIERNITIVEYNSMETYCVLRENNGKYKLFVIIVYKNMTQTINIVGTLFYQNFLIAYLSMLL